MNQDYIRILSINILHITPSFFKANTTGLRNIRILDMITLQNVFHTFQQFNIINKTNITQLDYNALKSSVPKGFKYVREPYIQSFQYKIINRILNTNEKLFKWSLKQSNR